MKIYKTIVVSKAEVNQRTKEKVTAELYQTFNDIDDGVKSTLKITNMPFKTE